jgi:hypothetical protein
VKNYSAFLTRNRDEWGFSRNGFIDAADQATITEAKKYRRKTGCIYNFESAWKKMPIVDRIELMLGWLETDSLYILDACPELIAEMESYSWMENKDNTPEDRNDHFINSLQYAWLPYKLKIGDLNNDSRNNQKAYS